MHRLQGARPAVGAKDSDPPPPDYATVVIESTRHTESIRQNGRMEEVNRHNGVGRMEEDMYMDPLNALTTFEMISPATQNLGGAFSLDLGKVSGGSSFSVSSLISSCKFYASNGVEVYTSWITDLLTGLLACRNCS